MLLDPRTEKRMRKDIERLATKRQKLLDKLAVLERKVALGRLDVTRFQAKRTLIMQQMRGFEMAARKRQGKLGKAIAARK